VVAGADLRLACTPLADIAMTRTWLGISAYWVPQLRISLHIHHHKIRRSFLIAVAEVHCNLQRIL
jgi:hypothetical protein